jgi:hypothetical protein
VSSGVLYVGQKINATALSTATPYFISALGTGTGLTGTYTVASTFQTAGTTVGSSGTPVAMVGGPDDYGLLGKGNEINATTYRKSTVSLRRAPLKNGDEIFNIKSNSQVAAVGTNTTRTNGTLRFVATEDYTTSASGNKFEVVTTTAGTNSTVTALSVSSSDVFVASTALNLNNPTTSSTYNNASNMKFTAGNPAGAGFNDRVGQINVTTASTTAGEASTITFNTGNYNTGTGNFSATQTGDVLGDFFFSGNYGTGSSFTTLGPSVKFQAKAAENFTATNSGGQFLINIDKIGGTSVYDAIKIDSANAVIASDIITLENAAGTDYAVLNSTSATFAQPVGFPVKTVAQWGAITGAVGQQVCVSNSSTSSTQTADGMMAYWRTDVAGWHYIHDNRAI